MNNDVGKGIVAVGFVLDIGKDLIVRVLGPSADYLGRELQSWTEKRLANLKRIFESANRKLGEGVDPNGSVPPRVLKGVVLDGSFCDDEVAAEYFGGVLASSRSGVPRDDRGAYYVSLLGRLSTYQIRAHYVFYHVIKALHNGSNLYMEGDEKQKSLSGFFSLISLEALDIAMDITSDIEQSEILTHTMLGLAREELISSAWDIYSIDAIGPLQFGIAKRRLQNLIDIFLKLASHKPESKRR